MTQATDPLSYNVGESNYSQMKIQPIEFSQANGLDAAAHTILKYLCRTKLDRRKDLASALHTIELREALEGKKVHSEGLRIPVAQFAAQFDSKEIKDFLHLFEDMLIRGPASMLAQRLQTAIKELDDAKHAEEAKAAKKPAPKPAAKAAKKS